MFTKNLHKLKQKMSEDNIDLSIITDDDSIYYFTGYHDFLHMDFNRPTLLIVSNDHQTYYVFLRGLQRLARPITWCHEDRLTCSQNLLPKLRSPESDLLGLGHPSLQLWLTFRIRGKIGDCFTSPSPIGMVKKKK